MKPEETDSIPGAVDLKLAVFDATVVDDDFRSDSTLGGAGSILEHADCLFGLSVREEF